MQGEDDVRGVRPEVAISWHRCREQYRVDPHLTEAPSALGSVDHTLEHDVIFTELGGLAASVAHEVDGLNGIVTVADAAGRILASWGDRATLVRASDANLAPWGCWSECAVGTNGMGTALEARGPVLIRGAEHWCRAFHDWVCAGVAVRHVVTGEPIAVMNISCWRTQLPEAATRWLGNAATTAQGTLNRRARDSGAELAAAFTQAKALSGTGVAAVDTAGKVVIADEPASLLMGVRPYVSAVDPDQRWDSGLPDLTRIVRYASKTAAHTPDWVGSTQIYAHLRDEPTPITIRPVFLRGGLVGHLIWLGGASEGAQTLPATGPGHPWMKPRRLVAVREDRTVLLRLPEVCFAESDGNNVWLFTDQGRFRSASQGLDKLDEELTDAGFLRVHRRYVVNLSRVREIERGFKGELFLVMDNRKDDMVPVSRRHASAVRRALGL
ncbi:Fis family transcriptional regulator [Streptomyces aurantiacus]|uniref:Fis family transcriptional regulator n=1 Tax=Streptomyces aurantiacus TaxID=47760 RepID=A0A7G1NY04_9ACTN|nr:Fis family transcriptional regulator [Streptomyces aurantiacus]